MSSLANDEIGGPPARGSSLATGVAELAQPLTHFVGRDRELRLATELISNRGVRLLTLTGPGGVGKTRLAGRLVTDLAPDFADGAAAVSLAPVRDANLLLNVIAQSLGVREAGDLNTTDRLAAALRGRQLLLLLDNFEQIIAAANDVADLLGRIPGLAVIVTSRVPLRIAGEQELAVLPFELPAAGVTSLIEISASPAVALFTQRAQAVRTDFELQESNAAVVAMVCQRLDGLPLAIELAAARAKVLSPSALLARLTNTLELLTGGPRDSPDRLQTMRGAISWSYDLLSLAEREFFESLAVFSGGFSLEAAAAVTGIDDSAVLELVTTLVDNSLIRINSDGETEPRFGMLETVREFALERLQEGIHFQRFRTAHADYFLKLAETAQPEMYGGPLQAHFMDQIERDHDNYRAALNWAEEFRFVEMSLRLGGALAFVWYVRGYLTEGRRWLANALAQDTGVADSIRADAMLGAGLLAIYQGESIYASGLIQEGLRLSRISGHVNGIFLALGLLGIAAEDAGDYETARQLYREGFEFVSPDNQAMLIPALLGQLRTHDGISAWGLGQTDEAIALWKISLADQRERGDNWGLANSLGYLALSACERGDFALAATYQHESLSLFWNARAIDDIAGTISNAACIIGSRGEYELAARIFSAADALREEIGSKAALPERRVFDAVLERIRGALPSRLFDSAWTAGHSLTLEESVAQALYALENLNPAHSHGTAAPGILLTTRESEVLRLLVAGQTDREIAAALYISPRTAQGHVSRLFAKLDVSTRTAAVALALQENLLN